MKRADVVQHRIAINNVFVGVSDFLSLALPPGWEITLGAGPPEVTASHQRNGRRWVATGDAWYILHNPAHRRAMEMRLTARLPGRSPLQASGPEITVAGHPARVTWKRRKRGFIKRWEVTYVTVEFVCPRTERRLKLEFSGRTSDTVFQEVVDAIQFLRCH